MLVFAQRREPWLHRQVKAGIRWVTVRSVGAKLLQREPKASEEDFNLLTELLVFIRSSCLLACLCQQLLVLPLFFSPFQVPHRFERYSSCSQSLGQCKVSVESAARVRNRLCPGYGSHPVSFVGRLRHPRWESDYRAMAHHVNKKKKTTKKRKTSHH